MRIFAKRFKELRNSMGFSKNKLARELNISYSTITRIEKGNTNIRMETLTKIVLYFKISSDYFLGRINEKKKIKDR